MDMISLKYIGIGMMSLSFACVGIGIGMIVSSFFNGAFRNPEAAPKLFTPFLLGLAFAEAVALFTLVVSILIIYN